MNKKIYSLCLLALCCISFACKAGDEQDEDENPDIALAREYHRINPRKSDEDDASKKICRWKIRAYTGALLVAFLVYRAADSSDND